jgi:hypothetical protein
MEFLKVKEITLTSILDLKFFREILNLLAFMGMKF